MWGENRESLEIFLRLARRWQCNDWSGRRTRIDDAAIAAQMDIYRIKKKHRARIMDDLLAMEQAALEVWDRDN